MKYLIYGLIIALVVVHQDVWNWENDHLVFGFLPWTLAYHACISIAASIVWFLAASFAWPKNLEDDDTAGANAVAATERDGGAA
ncbi:hypothetical protein CA13_23860 [Planctomycetes bacterium CA13]|uniref:DUF3311 domain-containing protein n=1 Tax=Novipirellula herctigrandis TaxID=2527986 RepID=A0A5C5Z0W6_9BACT|nr:hypothetical protein CA13_23860 [Planctomycetes bacterium CA13]